MAPPTQAASLGLLLLLLAATAGCAARPVVYESSPFTSQLARQLQQAPSNCTPPRTVQDTKSPFCFQPDIVSAEAQQFLANNSAGFFGDFGAALASGDPAAASGALQQARDSYRQGSTPLHEAAVAQYLQSVSNSTIGGVPVVIGVPKGVNTTDPSITRVMLYLHGGGYVVGSCQWLLNTVAVIEATAGLTSICPEYHLAPEHPFLADLNDILSVYKAMIQPEDYNPENIVVLGDSAGGGAVAAAAIQLQREKEPLPAALGMFLPWVDLATHGDTAVTLNAVDPVIPGRDPFDSQASGNNGLAYAYLGGNDNKAALASSNPLVSPVIADWAALFADSILPPTLIQVGLRETLLSDAVRLNQGMREAAPAPGRVVLSPYEGMWHVFQGYVFVPEAVVAGREMGGFFKAVLDGQVCKYSICAATELSCF